MQSQSESFDQPTQGGKPVGKKLTPRQKASIFAGLGGAATLGTIGTALAWGMSQDGSVNDKLPESAPDSDSSTTPAESKTNPVSDETKPEKPGDKPATEEHPVATTDPADEKPHQDKPAGEKPTNTHPESLTKTEGGGASTTQPNSHTTTEEHPSDNHPGSHVSTETEEPVDTTIPEPALATHVNDNMTQEDAFKAAREEVGAGGFFEWHGELYNTFYKEEWEGMSPEKRQAYIDKIYGDDEQSTSRDYDVHNDSTTQEPTPSSNETDNKPDIKVGQYEGHTIGLGDTDHDGDAEIIIIDNGTVGAVDTDNDGIMDTRVELNAETHQVESSSPLTSPFAAPSMNALDDTTSTDQDQIQQTNNADTSDEPEVVLATVDEHEVLLSDVDQDGYVDVMLADNGVMFVDTDGDHQFDLGVLYDTNTGDVEQVGYLNQGVDVPHLDHHTENNMADTQDYDNDSDMSEWAA
ncbi:hypothetical protein [Spirosoma panaciterrae]|uniref:hypothetical protein n=1 Tax=Spirosoma panaciterrae TaxID=496058 RepID=UPI000367962D|nr:hypothetical protein [Spirosoma panaciterrae]